MATPAAWVAMRRRIRVLPFGVLLSLLVLSCGPRVVRVSNGSSRAGRAISPQGYAAYLRGRLHEREGAYPLAIRDYEAALTIDPQAGEAWTRLGAIQCRSNVSASQNAFRRAFSLEPQSTSFWQARCECALQQGDIALAIEAAQNAIELDPEDAANSLLLIRAHTRAQNRSKATTLAWAHVALYPKDTEGWRVLESLHPTGKKEALEAEALLRSSNTDEVRFAHSAGDDGSSLPTPLSPALPAESYANAELVNALYARNSTKAAHAAKHLKLTTQRLALRAFQLGAFQVAFTEARRAHAISSDNGDAWGLALVLSDLLEHDSEFETLLRDAPKHKLSLNPNVANALAELLARRAGIEIGVAELRSRLTPQR